MKKIAIVVTVIVLGAGLWAGFVFSLPPALEITSPTRGPAVLAIYATGSVEPSVMVPISPKSGGRLVALEADEGQEVKKGDVLARLDDADLQNTISELSAKASFAKSEYARKENLLKQGLVSRQSFDQARSDSEAAEAALSRAGVQADYMKLIAPENGRIIRRDGEIGQMIAAGQNVFFLSCCAPLRISTEVDEEDIAKVEPGQKVLIRADAFPEDVFHGKVKSITPQGDSVARSYRVRIELDTTTPLLIGMTAETNIILRESPNALLVPSLAVRENKVQVVTGDTVHVQDVTIGSRGPEKTEIVSGLGETDRLLKTYNTSLSEGQKIRPVLGGK